MASNDTPSASALAAIDAVDPLALHRAGADRIDPDLIGAELDRERLGQPDHRPLRSAVRRAQRKAEAARGGRQIDDRAAARGPDVRHGAARAQVLPGDVDLERAPPVLGRDLLDRSGRPGDAGVVDQDVDAAELLERQLEQAIDRCLVRDVGRNRRHRGQLAAQPIERRLIDIARHDLGAGIDESLERDPADARAPRGQDRPLAIEPKIHVSSHRPRPCGRHR